MKCAHGKLKNATHRGKLGKRTKHARVCKFPPTAHKGHRTTVGLSRDQKGCSREPWEKAARKRGRKTRCL